MRRRHSGPRRNRRYGPLKLPMGNWAPAERPFRQSLDEDGFVQGFTLVHTDAGTGDRVEARVYEADNAGYARKSTGIPARVDPTRVWHLQRIEPRAARAYGGTIATLRYLAARADNHRAWLITEVMAESGDDAAVIRVLKTYGGFQDVPDPSFRPRLLVRRPTSSRSRS
jgi:hypothetical protein